MVWRRTVLWYPGIDFVIPDDKARSVESAKKELWTPPKGGHSLPEVWIPKAPTKKGTTAYKDWAMEQFLVLVQAGYNFSQAAERLGYTYRWWSQLSSTEKDWAALAREHATGSFSKWEYPDLTRMTFAEFVREFLGIEFVRHQVEIAAALEDPMGKLVLVLGHPESGKSTMISLWYPLYAIAQNRDTRIALVTKSGDKAQDLLTRLKRYLTEEHLYDDTPQNLIEVFNGFKPQHGDLDWNQDQIFIKHRLSGERDPTVQALGVGKQIYGARLDKLVLDDAFVQDNQISELTRGRLDNWFDTEAKSRAQKGQTIVNGTRLVPPDLYGQWKKAWKGMKTFRCVIIPAILDEYTEQERVNWPEYWSLDGYDLIEEIDGEDVVIGYQEGMRDIRESIVRKSKDRWRLVYQQEDVEETSAIFTKAHIDAALELGAHRKMGTVFDHERLILGIDPATTGRAAAILLAVDPTTRVRTVVDIFVGSGLGATGIRTKLMYDFWERYGALGRTIEVTAIEENFVKTLRGDEALQARADAAHTIIAYPHTSGKGRHGKWDEEYGVSAMSGLFGGGLMAFASATPLDRERLQPLIDDLLIFPWADQQDAVLALWVANGKSNLTSAKPPNREQTGKRRGVPPNIQQRQRAGRT